MRTVGPVKNQVKNQQSTRWATFFAALAVVAVVLAFTVGKAWVSVPGWWEAEAHQVRQLRLNPFESFQHYRVWWGPWLNLIGNIALFVPVGYVAYRGSIARAVAWGALFSVGIETAQYVWALGYSDLDDFLFNTVGALCGAVVGASIGKRPTLLWTIAAMAAVVLVPYAALGLGL